MTQPRHRISQLLGLFQRPSGLFPGLRSLLYFLVVVAINANLITLLSLPLHCANGSAAVRYPPARMMFRRNEALCQRRVYVAPQEHNSFTISPQIFAVQALSVCE